MGAISLTSAVHADLCQVYVLLVVPSILTIFIKSNCPVSNPFTSGSALILQSAGFFITSPDICTLECCTETQLSPQFRKTFSELLLLSEEQRWHYTIRCIFQNKSQNLKLTSIRYYSCSTSAILQEKSQAKWPTVIQAQPVCLL